MTALTSIFGCAATDVTLERVRQLVAEALPESLTLEYKERFTRNLVDSIAAMANSYGGVILVGVSDQRALVGVVEPHDALDQRRLARAVLAEQRVDAAGLDPQRDVVERRQRAEALRHARRLEGEGAGHGSAAITPSAFDTAPNTPPCILTILIAAS